MDTEDTQPKFKDACTQTDGGQHDDASCQTDGQTDLQTGTADKQNGKKFCFFDVDMFDDIMLHFYTGLECRDKFDMVLRTLGGEQSHLQYRTGHTPTMTIPNQFLLTLIKLRRHRTNYDIALHFGTNMKTVGNIVTTWVNFMYRQ